MCTAAAYKTKDFYFGRTLDNDFSYGDEIVITPRNFPLNFTEKGTINSHFAMIGMAHVEDGCPLYYEAVNEKGLCMAGLNFVGNAVYFKSAEGKDNIAHFEFIPWLLCQCSDLEEAKAMLQKINITDARFCDRLPSARLHWIIADKSGALTVESASEGLKVYDNPVGVLTNNPSFDKQLFNLNNYMGLSAKEPENTFARGMKLDSYSRGMGSIGLPGDLSSQSRFVRAAFVKMNSVSGTSEKENVSQFFHILGSVEQQRGCCIPEEGKYEITIYTCCCNADKGIYYYTTYNNHRITAVDMQRENLDGTEIIRYAPVSEEQIAMQN